MKNKKSQTSSHKRRELSSKNPMHVVLKTNLKISMQGYHSLRYLRTLIDEVEKRYSVFIFEFSLEKNHLHLFLLVSVCGRLSHAMQFLASKLALYFNKCFGRKGSFWGQRFFSAIKTSAREIIRTICYVANQCGYKSPFENTMNSITQAEKYPWGIPPAIASRIGVGNSIHRLREVIESATLPYKRVKERSILPLFPYL
ncbi:MAG: transposase [Oligoflexia bacterium]|nr:transposase [Oligoflexia bacterium]